MTPDELLKATSSTINALGSAYYFAPGTLAVGKELGLDGFRWYFIGRGGVLGDVESPVVNAAFAYFNPALVAKMWDSAKAVISPREAGRRYHQCAADFGHQKFAEVPGLDAYNAAAEKVIAGADRDGLSLFAAVAAEPLVDDAPGRAMQLTAVLREFRGSAHLVAVLASGLRSKQAHFIKRPGDVKAFGYDESEVHPTTAEMTAAIEAAEVLTDTLVRPAFAVLTPDEADALAAGVGGLKAALG